MLKLCDKFVEHGLKQGTIKMLTGRIKMLVEKAESDDFASLLKVACSLPDNSTKQIVFRALGHLMQECDVSDEDKLLCDKEFRKIKAFQKTKSAEPKEVAVKDITKTLNETKRRLKKQLKKTPDDPTIIRKWLIWNLYCLMLPRRSQEYREMRLKPSDTYNYWDNVNKQFIIRNHKTSASEGGTRVVYNPTGKNQQIDYHDNEYLIIIPPKAIKEIIERLIENDKEGEFMFPWKDGKEMNAVQYNRFQKTVLGVSTNDLRKVAVCKATRKTSTPTKKSIKIGRAMGHSANTQQTYYKGEDKG